MNSSKQKYAVQKNLHKSASAIVKRLELLKQVDALKRENRIQFPTTSRLTLHDNYAIMGDDITLKRGNKTLLDKVNFQLPLNKTIALIGNNGTGKSSLLTYILEQNKGVTVSSKAEIMTYQQMDYRLTQFYSPLELLISESDYPEHISRTLLTRLGFLSQWVHLPLKTLSGGEATRIALARVFAKPSNILILDEPTNFIDLNTREALEDFIIAYPGTVLLVSHDRYFVEKVADHLYKIEDTQLKLIK